MVLKNIGALNYSIGSISLQIRYSPNGLIKHLDNLIAKYNFINSTYHLIKPEIKLSIFVVSHLSFRKPKKTKLILRGYSYDLKVYKKESHLFITDNSNLLILQTEYGKGTLIIKRQDNLNLALVLNRFFLIALVGLFRPLGLFHLHAAGVAKNGHKILFVSQNGQGKSTSVLRLFSEGWKYLSDDAVFLKYNNKRQVMALSLTSELRLKKQNPILNKDSPYSLQKFFKRNN